MRTLIDITDSPFWAGYQTTSRNPTLFWIGLPFWGWSLKSPPRFVKYFFGFFGCCHGCRRIPACLKLKVLLMVFVDSSGWLSAFCS